MFYLARITPWYSYILNSFFLNKKEKEDVGVAWVVPSVSQGKFYFFFSLSVNMSCYWVLCTVIINMLNCPFV
jgi:hypothetical protein